MTLREWAFFYGSILLVIGAAWLAGAMVPV